MGNQLLGSKITIEEEAPSIRAIPAFDTAVAAFVGITEKGPVNVATITNSFSDYQRVFGGWTADAAEMVAAVQGFFENGGSQLYIVRVTAVNGSGVSTATAGTITLVNASSANTLKIDGKYLGTYSHGYRIRVGAPTSGDSTGEEFNLEVIDSAGFILEAFPNLTMSPTALRYAVTVINDPNTGSSRITADDLDLAGSTATRRPAYATSAALSGGAEALPSADAHYVGTQAFGNGIYALDLVDDLTILAVPGVATAAVCQGMVTYAEVIRGGQVFCIFDPPVGASADAIITYASSTIGLQTEYAAIYWPQLKISNPSKTVFGNVDSVVVPPSGHVAGVYARNDNASPGGVYRTPAGTEAGRLFGVVGLESDSVLKEAVRDRVFPKRINPITTMKGFPRFIDGARTLKGDGNWPTVAQRRGVSFIERSIKSGLEFARHMNNTPELRSVLHATAFQFLKNQTDLGAFASDDPTKAYFVDVGDQLNPVSNPNVIVARIGLATAQPAEFIRLLFSQDTRALAA
jgi:phage tail sheath protein FI